jgi:hypothetical protein
MRLIATLAVLAVAIPGVSVSDADSLGVAYLCSAEKQGQPSGPQQLKIMPGMGSGGFTIKTAAPEAQLWFDYGVKLYHGFYHDEAKVAFAKAAELDPTCAMCAWGQALAHGSTQNYDAEPDEIAKARAFAGKAAALTAGLADKDQALVAAMQARYVGKEGDNAGYAKAMEALAARYPDDKEIAVLAAHADLLLAVRKFDLPTVNRAVALLEGVLKASPDDTAAIHYYIHATEFMGEAPKALPYAEKLARLAPEASHLVHMAAHTLMRVGRYQEVALTNANAIAVDARFADRMGYKRALGEAFYYGHNYGFGLAGAMMAGDRELALKYADHADIAFPANYPIGRRNSITARVYMAIGTNAPERALAVPEGPQDAYVVKAMRHYARGEAFAVRRDAQAVLAESKAIRKLRRKGAGEGSATLAELAAKVLEGRSLMLSGNPRKAAKLFEQAAKLQESAYGDNFDPPPWWYPIRRSLAAAHFKAGDYKAAETEAKMSLKRWPNDALALWVQGQAKIRQGQVAPGAQDLALATRLWRGDLARISADRI